MSVEDRESLREARADWSSPEIVALFEEHNLKAEVLRSYKKLRRCGQDPLSALSFALDDWDLAYGEDSTTIDEE